MHSFQAGSDAAKRTSSSETHPAYGGGHLPDINSKNDSQVVSFGHHLGSGSGRLGDDPNITPKISRRTF